MGGALMNSGVGGLPYSHKSMPLWMRRQAGLSQDRAAQSGGVTSRAALRGMEAAVISVGQLPTHERLSCNQKQFVAVLSTSKGTHMNIIKGKMRILFFVGGLAMLLVFSAQARPFIQAVSAFGTGTDADQNTARNYAKEDAEGKLFCAGTLQNIRTVISGCVDSGSNDSGHNWVCMANATAQCVIGQ